MNSTPVLTLWRILRARLCCSTVTWEEGEKEGGREGEREREREGEREREREIEKSRKERSLNLQFNECTINLTLRTACEREDVRLAAVGSHVRLRFPLESKVITSCVVETAISLSP